MFEIGYRLSLSREEKEVIISRETLSAAKNENGIRTNKTVFMDYQSCLLYTSDTDIASLRVFMATLRKKLEPTKDSPQYIQTHIGVGYRMILSLIHI